MFVFTITEDGKDPVEVKASMRDVLVWEKAGRDRSMAGLVNDMHLADVYAVAHIACKRQQVFTGTLAEFEASVDLTVAEDVPPDPTQSGPSTEG